MDMLVQFVKLHLALVSQPIHHRSVTAKVLAQILIPVFVTPTGKANSVLFLNALVLWLTVLLFVVDMVRVLNLTHAFAKQTILAQLAKLQPALVFWPMLLMFVAATVLAHSLIHVFAAMVGLVLHAQYLHVLEHYQIIQLFAVVMVLVHKSTLVTATITTMVQLVKPTAAMACYPITHKYVATTVVA